jgi:hypothetical protein
MVKNARNQKCGAQTGQGLKQAHEGGGQRRQGEGIGPQNTEGFQDQGCRVTVLGQGLDCGQRLLLIVGRATCSETAYHLASS